MKKEETEIKDKVYKFLNKEIGGWWVKMVGSAFQQAGIPDIIGVPPRGIFCAIEIKTKIGKLSRLQQINLDKINKTKGFGIVINDFGDREKMILKVVLY